MARYPRRRHVSSNRRRRRLIGPYMGLMFHRPSLRYAGTLLPYIVGATYRYRLQRCIGLGVHALAGEELLRYLLAASPGGLDSVTPTAMSGGTNIAVAVAADRPAFTIICLGPALARRGDVSETS